MGRKFYAEKCIMSPLGIIPNNTICILDAYRLLSHKSNRQHNVIMCCFPLQMATRRMLYFFFLYSVSFTLFIPLSHSTMYTIYLFTSAIQPVIKRKSKRQPRLYANNSAKFEDWNPNTNVMLLLFERKSVIMAFFWEEKLYRLKIMAKKGFQR